MGDVTSWLYMFTKGMSIHTDILLLLKGCCYSLLNCNK